MRLFELESDEKSIYFCFINSNPPTFGYKRALDKVRELSGDASMIAFINPAQDKNLFPLSFKENLAYNRKIFPQVHFDQTGTIENPIQALKKLSKDYSKIYFVTRDKSINEFKRMYTYAEQWGVSSFEIIGMGDSSRPLPTGTAKAASIQSVVDNDFESFKKSTPSNDVQLISRLFLDLRKIIIDDSQRQVDGSDDITESVYVSLKAINDYNKGFLTESIGRDIYHNKTFVFEGLLDSLKNLKLVFNPKSTAKVKVARDTSDQNIVIIMKCNQYDLDKFMELNESVVRKAIQHYITETTTSANIASTVGLFGDIVRRPIDTTVLDDMTFTDHVPKYIQALNHIINTYGYMTQEAADKIREYLETQ